MAVAITKCAGGLFAGGYAWAAFLRPLACLITLTLPLLAQGQTPLSISPQDTEFFEKSVRPLLVQRCYSCHAGKEPRGGLSLETRSGWLKGGASGAAIVPGDPEKSLLIKAVNHQAGAPAMPPGGSLTVQEIGVLSEWVKRGAPDPRNAVASAQPTNRGLEWSLLPLKRVSPPKVKNTAWVHNPIDSFVLSKLEVRGLQPNPPADRRTLIRRVTYDLTGLPPTPEEVDAFVADHAHNAYEKLVDRLLASPRYGERWGRHWLDVVHYGDTHGYDKDKRRDHAWPYRDYVINAFNTDKPYGQFVEEQLAGDVLYPQDPQATVATGFLAAGPWDFVGQVELAEGTVEKEKTRLIDRDDIVSTVMSTFDSVTVHCARCHNHKFDPIPQKDYYRLQAVFAGIERGDRPYTDSVRKSLETTLRKQRTELISHRDSIQAQIRSLTSQRLHYYDTQINATQKQLGSLPLPVQETGSPTNGYHSAIVAQQDQTKWVQVDLGAPAPLDKILLIPARPTDFKDTPGFGFPVRFQIAVSNDPAFKTATLVEDRSSADFPNPGDSPVEVRAGGLAARYIRVTALRLWLRTNDYIFALAELQAFSHGANIALGKTVTALDSIEAGRWSVRNLVDNYDSRNPLPDLSNPQIVALVNHRNELSQQIATLRQARQNELEALIDPTTRAERERVNRALASIEAQIAAMPPASLVYAVTTHVPRPTWILNRGDVEQHGERVGPGALSCVPGLDSDFKRNGNQEEGQGRAALAAWIVDPNNTLTWRSIVNRVWHYHFSRGIVETPNDFGRNGALPSHPELLDWLAIWFLENGQSIKKLHRLILLSATYQQSSTYSAACAKVDADNHLLWRMNRRRLEAEEVRDSVLAVSGKLNLTAGGPGFELFRFKDDHSPIYDYSNGAKLSDPATFRRTIYEYTVRSVPDPFLETLDSADPNALTPVRNTTLTALQALALRNDPFMVLQAGYFADRLRNLTASPTKQIDIAYRLLYGRMPSETERDALLTYVRKYGLSDMCRLLLNTNEYMFLD